MRTLPLAAAGIVALFIGAFIGLKFIWPAPPIVKLPPLAAVPPLEPIARKSTMVAPAAIAISAIQAAMESAAPRNLAGKREGVTRELPINVNIAWTIDRGPLTVAGRSEQLAISVPLTGSLRASGQLGSQLSSVTGSLSALGGNIGRQVESLAGKSFDQHADVRGNVLVNAHPALLPGWRIAPNLVAQASINDVGIPVAGLRLSVANEVKPLVDRSVREQVAALEARVRNDPFLERTVREQWTRLCHSFPLGAAGAGAPNLWLEIKPMRGFAAQPRIDATAVTLTLGVEAETRIVTRETKPTCPFPAQVEIVPQLNQGTVNIGVPIDIPFTEVNRLLQAQLGGRTFPEDGSGSVDLTIRHAEVAASGDRLLISLLVKARERSFFSLGAEASVHVWGKPLLDRDNQILRLTDVEYDVDSAAAFGLLGAAARAAAPYLRTVLAEKAAVDLKPFTADARKKIEAVLADFQKRQGGVRVDAKVNTLRLVGIAFDATSLRVIAEAEGAVNVAVSSLAMP